MESLAKLRMRSAVAPLLLCALCLFSLSSQTAVAQGYTWQFINQPKINYLSAVAVHPLDANRVLLSAEHDGNGTYSTADSVLRWTFVHPSAGEYPHVHSTR